MIWGIDLYAMLNDPEPLIEGSLSISLATFLNEPAHPQTCAQYLERLPSLSHLPRIPSIVRAHRCLPAWMIAIN